MFIHNAKIFAIQVYYELTEENQEREVDGLVEALKKFKLNTGLILTYNQKDKIMKENKKIVLKPVWEWFLETKK